MYLLFLTATRHNSYQSNTHLVLEFCEHDLAGLLSQREVLFSLGQIKNLVRQLLSGVEFLHSKSFLHRDIKSANVLVTKTGGVKIADLGLARAFRPDRANRYTNRVVTLWYRSPELLLGDRNYGPPLDMWGVGCIMAEMWTRSPIFQGATEQRQLSLISQLCGSVTPEVWPDVERLEIYRKVELPQGLQRKTKERLMPFMRDSYAMQLLDRLLVLDPKQRIDASSALKHDFFRMEPRIEDLAKTLSYLKTSKFHGMMLQRRAQPARSSAMIVKPQNTDQYWDQIY